MINIKNWRLKIIKIFTVKLSPTSFKFLFLKTLTETISNITKLCNNIFNHEGKKEEVGVKCYAETWQ